MQIILYQLPVFGFEGEQCIIFTLLSNITQGILLMVFRDDQCQEEWLFSSNSDCNSEIKQNRGKACDPQPKIMGALYWIQKLLFYPPNLHIMPTLYMHNIITISNYTWIGVTSKYSTTLYISDLFKLPHMVPNIINLLGERQIKCLAQPNDLTRNGTYNIRWQLYIVHGLTKQTTTPSITLIRQTCTSRNIVSLII